MYMKYHYSIIILFCSLFANVQPPSLFQYNQGSFQAFYFFKNVTIDSIKVSPDDWVGTFNCTKWNKDSTVCVTLGPCVGARKWNTQLCGGGICDLPAIGTDQSASLEVHAMDLLRKRLKNVKQILGSQDKIITESEKQVLKKLRG